jgi:choline-glycine betaine transporter
LKRFNLILALVFLTFVFFLTDKLSVMGIYIESIGMYFQRFIEIGTWSSSFVDSIWQNNWTIFYYAWWVAWAPFVGIFMVSVFFLTSSDSCSLVIDSITTGGKLDSPVGQRIFWALIEGFVAITLLLGGGLAAMQTASVSSGILITYTFCHFYFLVIDLKKDLAQIIKIA